MLRHESGRGAVAETWELGPVLDWAPVAAPAREPLVGTGVRLEPIDPERHAAELFEAAQGAGADPFLWHYLGYGPFSDLGEFTEFARGQAASQDPLFFAIVDARTGKAAGVAAYMRIE